jgi:hypothetical protein
MMRSTSLLFAITLAACASADTKTGPEEGSTASESTISNYYTTIVGTLALGSTITESIDYPSYYLGRTIVLRKHQSLKLVVSSNRKSTVHFYGPASSFGLDGEPRFGAPMVRTATKKSGSKQTVTFSVTAPKDGTYMLVYGPDNVWNASFQITATCTANCEQIAAEGEECGGFVPVELFKSCEPQFECVAPHGIIADIPGRCGVYATVAELLANPAAYNGHYVAVRGEIQRRVAACTKIACPVSNPCCNQCHAALNLFDEGMDPTTTEGVYLTENGASLGCSGNSCDYQNHCSLAGGDYWVSGWFTLDGGVTPTLDIDRRFDAF